MSDQKFTRGDRVMLTLECLRSCKQPRSRYGTFHRYLRGHPGTCVVLMDLNRAETTVAEYNLERAAPA